LSTFETQGRQDFAIDHYFCLYNRVIVDMF
jgi:hypothetical protein